MGLQTYNMDDPTQVTIPFPAPSRTATSVVNELSTEVRSLAFSDKIMITITQKGKLGQWVSRAAWPVRKKLTLVGVCTSTGGQPNHN